MKIKQIIISEVPNDYEDIQALEMALLQAGQTKTIPELIESIDPKFKLEEEMIFPDDISEKIVHDALYGCLIKRLRDIGIDPFQDYFIDVGLIDIDGKWKNFYEYDGEANIVHFKEKV